MSEEKNSDLDMATHAGVAGGRAGAATGKRAGAAIGWGVGLATGAVAGAAGGALATLWRRKRRSSK